MRRWLPLLVLLAACGEDKTAEFTAQRTTTTAVATAAVSTTATTTTSTTTTLVEAPVMLSGDGKTQTAPFRLAGGRYKSTWQTFNDCAYYGHLYPGRAEPLTADGATTGETFMNDVKAGEYYVDMNTGPVPRCRWQITLQRA